MGPDLELRGITKSFDATCVLKGADLNIVGGEITSLVGPSGCGKSTILRIIAGLETADSGDILIAGQDCTSSSPAARNVGMAFQDNALYPHRSVRRNLELPLRARKYAREKIGAMVTDMAELLKIDQLLDRSVDHLSGGERQRVSLGRALIRQPGLLLLDEPFSSVDAHLRRQLRHLVCELHQRFAPTTLYVTHDVVEAMTIGGTLAVLYGGRVQQVGPPKQVYQRPATLFIAEFTAITPVNQLEGVLTDKDGCASVQWQDELFRLYPEGDGDRTVGRSVKIAIRAEDVLLERDDEVCGWEAQVTRAVPEGAMMLVSLSLKGQTLDAAVPYDLGLTGGSRCNISLRSGAGGVYDAQTGLRLGSLGGRHGTRRGAGIR